MNPNFIPSPLDAKLAMDVANALSATGYGTSLDMGINFAPPNIGMPCSVTVQPTTDTVTGTQDWSAQVFESNDNATWTAAGPVVATTAGSTNAFSVPAFLSKRYVVVYYTLGGAATGASGAAAAALTVNSWLAPYGGAVN